MMCLSLRMDPVLKKKKEWILTGRHLWGTDHILLPGNVMKMLEYITLLSFSSENRVPSPLEDSGLGLRWDLPPFWKVSCLPCSIPRFPDSHRTYQEDGSDVVVKLFNGHEHFYRPKWGCVGPRSQARLYILIFFLQEDPMAYLQTPNSFIPSLKAFGPRISSAA